MNLLSTSCIFPHYPVHMYLKLKAVEPFKVRYDDMMCHIFRAENAFRRNKLPLAPGLWGCEVCESSTKGFAGSQASGIVVEKSWGRRQSVDSHSINRMSTFEYCSKLSIIKLYSMYVSYCVFAAAPNLIVAKLSFTIDGFGAAAATNDKGSWHLLVLQRQTWLWRFKEKTRIVRRGLCRRTWSKFSLSSHEIDNHSQS